LLRVVVWFGVWYGATRHASMQGRATHVHASESVSSCSRVRWAGHGLKSVSRTESRARRPPPRAVHYSAVQCCAVQTSKQASNHTKQQAPKDDDRRNHARFTVCV